MPGCQIAGQLRTAAIRLPGFYIRAYCRVKRSRACGVELPFDLMGCDRRALVDAAVLRVAPDAAPSWQSAGRQTVRITTLAQRGLNQIMSEPPFADELEYKYTEDCRAGSIVWTRPACFG